MTKTPMKIRNLQRKLFSLSKCEPSYRFYSLYDKIYRKDILNEAFIRSKRNGGVPGIDNQTFDNIEEYGVQKFLEEIETELKGKTYRPNPLKRVFISKDDGKLRPLGISTIRDRVVQTACKIVLEPIFEPDLHHDSYGYRPNKNAIQAVKEIEKNIKEGYVHIYDADLSKYFDSIPHQELMEKLGRKISDQEILKILQDMIKAPVIEVTEKGKMKNIANEEKGVPQGNVCSPLMANIYLNDFCCKIAGKTPCKIVTYADDFVILHKKPYTDTQLSWFENELKKEGLQINQLKTKVVNISILKSEFNFLGFLFKKVKGYIPDTQYVKIQPSKKAQKKFKETIREIVKHRTSLPIDVLILRVNRVMVGWCNYFKAAGYPKKVFFMMDWFVVARFYKWALKLSQRGAKRFAQNAWEILRSKNLKFLQPLRPKHV